MSNLKYLCVVLIVLSTLPLKYSAYDIDLGVEDIHGDESCHPIKDDAINVHIVAHTHDDVGWLKTVDQYYYGSKTRYQKAGVQYILDSVVDALTKDSSRKFIYVETAYFSKWWQKQDETVKRLIRDFVRTGQLEFVGGAWSMNDEATTNYQSIIDQFTWGLRFLNKTFGECGRPKVGWQIDPFGHSREQASLFAQMGFDGLLLGRIDYQDRAFRFKTKSPEMIWHGSANLGTKADLFTSVMFNTYSPPPGFCFDVLCDDDPIIDDKQSPDYNVDERLNDFLSYIFKQHKAYQTNNLIVTMGGDFTYMDANMWFTNLDKLIRYANERTNMTNVHLLYSTPSCYLKSVHADATRRNITFLDKSDDFFPYASDPTAYWTGYFTSKPTIKRYERLGNNYMQICKQLYVLADLDSSFWTNLNAMREAMGILQHHDAITGTEKDHVAQDYSRILSEAFKQCDIITSAALNKLIKAGDPERNNGVPNEDDIGFETCLLTNISQCALTEKQKKFMLTVYNPLSHDINHFVRFPVTSSVEVKDADGQDVPVQILPIHESVLNVPGRTSVAKYEAVFKAQVPALGFHSYFVKKIVSDIVLHDGSKYSISNGNIVINLDGTTGKISGISINGYDVPFSNDFFYYESAFGNNMDYGRRSSGAYIFRPNGSLHNIVDVVTNTIYEGSIVSEIHQTFNNWISQVVRLYTDVDYVEFEWLVGPIPVNDGIGKEVVTKYMTEMHSKSTFYTDSNGREMIKRVKDFRPTWMLYLTEPIPGNYYPVTSKILIRDAHDDLEMAVLTDRAQGGTSLTDGHIELMVHRRCLYDDAFGVNEALNEVQFNKGLVVRGSHSLVIGPFSRKQGLAAYERDLAQRKLLQAWTFFSSSLTRNLASFNNLKFSGLTENLPKNVHILTLEPWDANTLLLRLEHILENDEDSHLSQPVKVNLKNAFKTLEIVSMHETTLDGNQWLEDNNRPKFYQRRDAKFEDFLNLYSSYIHTTAEQQHLWKRGNLLQHRYVMKNKSNTRSVKNFKRDILYNEFDIVLNPMEIRTFVVKTC